MLFGSDFPLITPDRWLRGLRAARDPRRGAPARAEGERRPAARPMSDLSWPLQRAARLFAGDVAVVDGERSVTYARARSRACARSAGSRRNGSASSAPTRSRTWSAGSGCPRSARCSWTSTSGSRSRSSRSWSRTPSSTCSIVDDERRELGEQLGVPLLEDYEALVAGPARAYPASTSRHAGRDLLHGRHDRHAQGRDAQPPQPARQRAAQPRRHRPRARGPLAARLPDVPRRRDARTSSPARGSARSQVLLPRFEAARRAGRRSSASASPTPCSCRRCSRCCSSTPRRADLSSVRHLQYAASPISPDLQRRVLEWLPDCDVVQFYGMTEAAPTVTRLSRPRPPRAPRDRLRSMGAAGARASQAEVRAPHGEVGELWVRGPNVMLGYWNRPDATAEALVDGWYRTGDLARADEDGYLYMVDRAKDMIITRRRERLLGRGRGRAAQPPGGRRGRGLRHPRRALGRGRARGRRAARRRSPPRS